METNEIEYSAYQKAKQDLAYYAKQRKTFLTLAILCCGASTILFILQVVLGVTGAVPSDSWVSSILSTINSAFVTGAIAFFILFGVLYRSRIATRQKLIDEYEKREIEEF